MEAYFDNSATTRCFEEVKDIVVKTMMEDFGNPSAMHQKGARTCPNKWYATTDPAAPPASPMPRYAGFLVAI